MLIQQILTTGFNQLALIIDRALTANRLYPFVIGLTGNVASGKSTMAAQLACQIRKTDPRLQVVVITTDSFLQPNALLQRAGLMARKGFPETYDKVRMKRFATLVQAQDTIEIPVYSHQCNDILPGVLTRMAMPDVLFIEGLLTLNYQFIDLLDLSFFIDCDPEANFMWFRKRCAELKLNDRLYHLSQPAFNRLVAKKWHETNWRNYMLNILPMKTRAHYLIHLDTNHQITAVTNQIKGF